MAKPKITATIDPLGNVVIETKGFKGKSCVEATEQIEKALGKVTKDEKTWEYRDKRGARSKKEVKA